MRVFAAGWRLWRAGPVSITLGIDAARRSIVIGAKLDCLYAARARPVGAVRPLLQHRLGHVLFPTGEVPEFVREQKQVVTSSVVVKIRERAQDFLVVPIKLFGFLECPIYCFKFWNNLRCKR